MPKSPLQDRFLGCLLGCAVGDALGAPLEGLWWHQIPGADELLAGFQPIEGYPRGQYTDDTQLSVATVRAIVKAGEVSPPRIARAIARLWEKESVVGPGGACTITPFVVPTVLAALWCVLRTPDSWSKAVSTAIGLGGDVDTLGAIVGALMGARLGIDAIPQHLVEDVLDSDRLKRLAARYHALVMDE